MTAEGEDDGLVPGYTRRHALIIGIDEYDDPTFPDLGYAVADARAIARSLVEQFGFAQQDVRLLINGDATKDALDETLEVWASDPDRVGKNDLLVIFYAGHGVTRDLGSRGSRGYLVPADGRSNRQGTPNWGSLTGMNFLEDVSEAIPSKHALFLLDCCFGGLAVNRAAPPVAAGLNARARQVITAGGADQTVLDSGGRAGHSVFTGAILDGFEGKADLDADGVVTFGELYNHVGRDVEKKTGDRQTPLQATFADHEGGSVALFPPGLEPGRMSAAERLKEMERSAEEYLAELRRLSDIILLDQLVAAADDLFPATPDRAPAFRNWLVRARDLVKRRSQHEESVRIVRQEAYLKQVLAGLLEEGEGTEPLWEQVDQDLRWRFETFSTLLEHLDLLDSRITDVERRLSWALRIEELTRNHPNAIYSWAEAHDAIAAADGVLASELYAEHPLDLEPLLGLVPIGMNPVTLLWEFYDLRTAYDPGSGLDAGSIVIPEHREDGTLDIQEETGLVFVLIPGGRYRIGAQFSDPESPHHDPQSERDESPVHEVVLDPFLLSRYELTQGQWKRLTGKNPSLAGPEGRWSTEWDSLGREADLTHPVEQVSRVDCMRHLPRHGLRLPSEEQWEAACRAGTETIWWTGNDLTDLDVAGNLSDQYGKTHGNESWETWEEQLHDGSTGHARVGSYLANPFGLHDMIGNVWEWCLDDYSGYDQPGRRGDGTRLQQDAMNGVGRGGSFDSSAGNARSANRDGISPALRFNTLGCRPARDLRAP